METQYGDDRRTAGSRSECAAVLVELEAAIAGAQALFDSDVAAGLSVSVEAQNGRRLLDQAMGRVEELRGLIEPE